MDVALPAIIPPKVPLTVATHMATLMALAILPFLAQGFVHDTLSKLRHLHTKSIEGTPRTLPLLLVIGVCGIFLMKILTVTLLPGAAAALLTFIILVNAIKYLITLSKETKADRKLMEENPWARVQRWEHQLIIFATLPLLLARLIGICGAIADLPADSTAVRLAFTAVSALFLAMLRPDRSLFMGLCKSCKQPVPIAFRDLGCCLNCSLPLRVAFHRWTHRVALPVEAPSPFEKPPKTETPPATLPTKSKGIRRKESKSKESRQGVGRGVTR